MSDPKDVSTPSPETAPQPAPETPETVAEATAAPVEQPVPASPVAEEQNFAQLLEQYESESETAGPKVGEHRSGTVVNVKEDVVLVDIGAKAEGTIAIDQVRTPGGTVELKAGDPLEVVIEGRDDEGNFVSYHPMRFELALATRERGGLSDDLYESVIEDGGYFG